MSRKWTEADLKAVKARIVRSTPIKKVTVKKQYRSKLETAFARQLELEVVAGVVTAWWYEPFSMWLPGKVRYKPDFMIQYSDHRQIEIIEVKGWSKNRRDGMTRLKVASSIFPCFTWMLISKSAFGDWEKLEVLQ